MKMGHYATAVVGIVGQCGSLSSFSSLPAAALPSFLPYGPHWKWGTGEEGRMEDLAGGIGDLCCAQCHMAYFLSFPLSARDKCNELHIYLNEVD